jgi:hypothetical protein
MSRIPFLFPSLFPPIFPFPLFFYFSPCHYSIFFFAYLLTQPPPLSPRATSLSTPQAHPRRPRTNRRRPPQSPPDASATAAPPSSLPHAAAKLPRPGPRRQPWRQLGQSSPHLPSVSARRPPLHHARWPPPAACPPRPSAMEVRLRPPVMPVPAGLLSTAPAGLLRPPLHRARRPWRRATAPPPAPSAPRPHRSSAPPPLRSSTACGAPRANDGKPWAEPQAERGELRFSTPSRRNGSSHRDFREILSPIHFHRPSFRDSKKQLRIRS